MGWEAGRGRGVNVRGCYPCAVMSGRPADTTMIIQDQLDLEQHNRQQQTHKQSTPAHGCFTAGVTVSNGINSRLGNTPRPDGTKQHIHLLKITLPVGWQKSLVHNMSNTLVFHHEGCSHCHCKSLKMSIKHRSLCDAPKHKIRLSIHPDDKMKLWWNTALFTAESHFCKFVLWQTAPFTKACVQSDPLDSASAKMKMNVF